MVFNIVFIIFTGILKMTRLISVLLAGAIVSSCALRPLPVDYSTKTTLEIVDHIRCEALGAIIIQVARRLEDAGTSDALAFASELRARVESGYLVAGEKDVAKATRLLEEAGADDEVERVVRFEKYVIAYDYVFDISEKNNFGGDATFSLPFTNGTFSIKSAASADRTRAARRSFKLADSFQVYLELAESGQCANHDDRANMEYPITGEIGLSEVFITYFNLEDTRGGVEDFTDRLMFTTKLDASLTPSVTLTPVSDEFRLANGKLTALNERNDLHQVTIALRRPKGKEADVQGAFELLRKEENLEAFRTR